MNIEDALRKIRKCMAMAKDGRADPAIAASAMRQAQALMAEFKLQADDARLTDVTKVECTARTNAHPRWESNLASAIADAFGCDFIWTKTISWNGRRNLHKAGLAFIGVGAAPQVAAYAWDVLSRQCAKARLTYINAQPGRCKQVTLTARGDVFAIGWVQSATKLLQKLAGNEQELLLIEAFKRATWPDAAAFTPPDRTKGRNITDNDFYSGILKGRDAQLNHGVGATQQGLLT